MSNVFRTALALIGRLIWTDNWCDVSQNVLT